MLKRVRIIWIVLFSSFGCGDASIEGGLSHSLIPIAGPIPMCHGSERYPVEYTVITGKYLRSNINNSRLERSLILSIADAGRIM